MPLFENFFFCSWQRFSVWSLLVWSRGRSPRSRSPPPPSITPTGPPNDRVSTTMRTAGRRPTTPSGSGSRSVRFGSSFLEMMSDGLVSESDLIMVLELVPPRCCSHVVWILFTHLCNFPARDGGTRKKVNMHYVLTSASAAQQAFLIFIVKSDLADKLEIRFLVMVLTIKT